jgi:hypothetical protein
MLSRGGSKRARTLLPENIRIVDGVTTQAGTLDVVELLDGLADGALPVRELLGELVDGLVHCANTLNSWYKLGLL